MKFCQSIPQSRWRGRTLMLLALLLCIALPKTSSAQRVSVVLENVSLAEALKKVSAASGYEFFYNSNVVLKSDKRITASFDGTELKTVLDHVFSGTEFSYRIKDRTIVVVPRPAQPAPEEPAFVEIAGRITDRVEQGPDGGRDGRRRGIDHRNFLGRRRTLRAENSRRHLQHHVLVHRL